jgi:hypothetical protein
MNIKRRLQRLENVAAAIPQPARQKSLDQVVEEFMALSRWLAERGYADALAAVEAGDVPPEDLASLLREQAENRRACKEFEEWLASPALLGGKD